jgi:hypothetical protein
MKRAFINLLLLSSGFIFFTCDKAKDLIDVEFETDITTTLPVAATDTDEGTYSILLDATVDSEIQQYADKIKKYEIKELWIAVENYTASTQSEIYFNGDLGFSSKSEGQPASSCSISSLNITHVAGTGDFEINNCNTTLSDIATALTNDNAVKVYLVGAFTDSPVAFDLKITIKVEVTASPL